MCGLVSVITKSTNGFSKDQCDIFDTLLFADQLRGADSTGVFLVSNDGRLDMAKEASDATVFRKSTEYKDIMSRAYKSGSILVGHNRAATKGEIKDENAHPFIVDNNITLVHNGTLYDHKKLADTEVDSHAIAHTIHKYNDDVEKALWEISGAYALIWHDFKNQTVNYLRNSQRPLHFIEIPGAYLWASEMNMLSWMLTRFNIKTENKIRLLEEGMLSSFKLSNRVFLPENRKISMYKPSSNSCDEDSIYAAWTNQNDLACAYMSGGNTGPLKWPEDNNSQSNNETTETKESKNSVPPSKTHSNSAIERINKIEETLAHNLNIHMSYPEYTKIVDGIGLKGRLTMVCKEVTEIHTSKPQLGYWLYGVLPDYEDIMVKVHMPPNTNETDLLDWTLNEKQISVEYQGLQWSAYRNKEHMIIQNDGYGIVVCKSGSVKEISKLPVLLDSMH